MLSWLAVFLMGLVLGTVGGGGGILTVPILVGLFGLSATEATCGSLLVVGLTSALGATRGLLRGEADFRAALVIAIPSSLGALLARALLVPAVPPRIGGVAKDHLLLGGFALLITIVALRMILPSKASQPEKRSLVFTGLIGVAIGLVSGTFGAGGGFLILPALILFVGLETKQAIATSLVVIAIQSMIGFFGDLSSTHHWSMLLQIAGLASLGLLAGSLFRHRLPARALQLAFGVIALAVAVWMIAKIL